MIKNTDTSIDLRLLAFYECGWRKNTITKYSCHKLEKYLCPEHIVPCCSACFTRSEVIKGFVIFSVRRISISLYFPRVCLFTHTLLILNFINHLKKKHVANHLNHLIIFNKGLKSQPVRPASTMI